MPTVKLKLVEKTYHSQWWRTSDGKFDVLGDDLNCTSAAARAAGAGPVWSWRPAKGTSEWSSDMRSFASKSRCLLDLEQHLYQSVGV